jgi:membrane fusion protein, heavy metal efflux system
MNQKLLLFAIALLACIGSQRSIAGGDHNHDAPPQTSGVLLPRFSAHSEAFEIVGVLRGDALTVFVDRYDDNVPVLGAKVEIESGMFRAIGTFQAEEGHYKFSAAAFQQPGSYPVQITISAGALTDLLAADFVVPDPHAGHDHSGDDHVLLHWAGWLGGGVVLILAITGWHVMRSRRRQGIAS